MKTTTSKSTTSKSTKNPGPTTPRKPASALPRSRASQSYVFHQAIAALSAAREQLPLADASGARDAKALVARRRTARVPDAFLEAMASVVSRHGGALMGLSFDADAARELIAYGAAARPFIDVARDVARQVDEDIVHKRASLVEHAMCVLRAIEALAETPEGKGVARDAQLLRATLGTKKRKRPGKAAAADTSASPASEPPVLVPVRPTG